MLLAVLAGDQLITYFVDEGQVVEGDIGHPDHWVLAIQVLNVECSVVAVDNKRVDAATDDQRVDLDALLPLQQLQMGQLVPEHLLDLGDQPGMLGLLLEDAARDQL